MNHNERNKNSPSSPRPIRGMICLCSVLNLKCRNNAEAGMLDKTDVNPDL